MLYIVYYRHQGTTNWDKCFFKVRSNAEKQLIVFADAGAEIRLETAEFQDKFDA